MGGREKGAPLAWLLPVSEQPSRLSIPLSLSGPNPASGRPGQATVSRPLFLKSLRCSHPKPKEQCQLQIRLRPRLRAQRRRGWGIRPPCSCRCNSGRATRPASMPKQKEALGCPPTLGQRLTQKPTRVARDQICMWNPVACSVKQIFVSPPSTKYVHSTYCVSRGRQGLDLVAGGACRGCRRCSFGALLERARAWLHSFWTVWPGANHLASLSLRLLPCQMGQ